MNAARPKLNSEHDPQHGWGFEGEPPETVIRDSGTKYGTSRGRKLQPDDNAQNAELELLRPFASRGCKAMRDPGSID
jgi:hypothetical protein